MKNFVTLLFVTAVFLGACTKKTVIVKSPGAPKNAHAPGQIKKMTGSKSAAPYAPGQVKKNATASSASPSNAKKSTPSGNGKGNGNGKKK